MVIVSIIIVIIVLPLLFIFTHIYPLTEKEIKSLGNKRRNHQINAYYSFNNITFTVNSEFKKDMRPVGSFHKIEENLFDFPSLAAALLKYKKHEWIIVAFEKNKIINQFWTNKGKDCSSVALNLDISEIVKLAKKESYESVFVFHNHPNNNPNYFSFTKPSKQDITVARKRGIILNYDGINLVEFICERGKHYKYFLSTADNFVPLHQFENTIHEENGRSKIKNLMLHLELLGSERISRDDVNFPIGNLTSSETFTCNIDGGRAVFYLDLVSVDLKSKAKEAAIEEIVRLFTMSGIVKDGNSFYKNLIYREAITSTGMGDGVAMPYAEADVKDNIVVAIAISKQGIDFDSLDEMPVKIIFTSAHDKMYGYNIPGAGIHLKFLALLSRFLKDQNVREALINTNSRDEVFQLIKNNFSRF